ncbi:ClC family H(+)/Cl(-) exchange transporter [Fusobacterium sp. PH5-44]|uniref:ClC family H(+)/Cl(-) exchange transporter n=1 Tax=unclassified Fusobacterium TaxID=2648384 RepID=UPI003D1E8028
MNSEEYIEDKNKKKDWSLYVLCLLVGVVTGLIVSFYRWILHLVGNIREHFFASQDLNNPLKLFLVLILFISVGLLINFIGQKYPKISGSGIPQVKGILMKQLKYVKWPIEIVAKFITGVFGISCGLSLGREGPSVQLGSYIGHGISKLFKKNEITERYLVTCGSSAGLSGAFGAPLAGVIFSLEELHRIITSKLLICTFIASIVADFIGRRFFGMQTAFNIQVIYPKNINPYFHFGLMIIFGVFIAFFGKLFTLTLIKTQDIFKGIKLSKNIKISFVMVISFILCFILPEVTGGGHELAEGLAKYNQMFYFLIIIFVIKLLFTAISYATGFAGGIFLPMLVLGAILGKIYAMILMNILNLGPEYIPHYIILGMAAFFVAVVKAPLTGTILILEMTGGFEHLLALATVSVVTYYVTSLLHLEPIYEILYERMEKDSCEIKKDCDRVIINIPVKHNSLLDDKLISEVHWATDILVVTILRDKEELIPNGDTRIEEGDVVTILVPKSKVDNMKAELFKLG